MTAVQACLLNCVAVVPYILFTCLFTGHVHMSAQIHACLLAQYCYLILFFQLVFFLSHLVCNMCMCFVVSPLWSTAGAFVLLYICYAGDYTDCKLGRYLLAHFPLVVHTSLSYRVLAILFELLFFFWSPSLNFIMALLSASRGGYLSRLWGATASYIKNVGKVYIHFIPPMVMMIVLNMAVDSRDKERFGLGWLYCTGLKDDRLREEKFPQFEPSSIAQKRRMDAANALDYAVSAA